MIKDVNDQPWRADLLGRLLAGKLAHVNLIPLNPTPGSRWDASPKPVEREFVRRLRDAGVSTTVRDTRGREIDGACGQLAAAEDRRTPTAPERHRRDRAWRTRPGDIVASQGQRFRRKALRRGYKVDEVDAFLDRVEATLDGEPVGAPVASQEVHDVVFRVRFNGYDEWQVDLHLDRVERQLAELEERSGAGRGGDPGCGDRMGPPDRMGAADARRPGHGAGPHRRCRPGRCPRRPVRPPTATARYDEPTGAFAGGYDAPRAVATTRRAARPAPARWAPAARWARGPTGRPAGPMAAGAADARRPGGYGPPDDQRVARRLRPGRSGGGRRYGPGRRPARARRLRPPPEEPRFDGFEAGRHGRADMTAEIRMPERDLRDMRRGPAGPPALPQQGIGGRRWPVRPWPAAMGRPADGWPADGRPARQRPVPGRPDPAQLPGAPVRQRVRPRPGGPALREPAGGDARPRPDAGQPEATWTPLRFGLVPGGYFEAEVDAALEGGAGHPASAPLTRTRTARGPVPRVGAGPSASSTVVRRAGAGQERRPLRRSTMSPITMISRARRGRSARCPRPCPRGCRRSSPAAPARTSTAPIRPALRCPGLCWSGESPARFLPLSVLPSRSDLRLVWHAPPRPGAGSGRCPVPWRRAADLVRQVGRAGNSGVAGRRPGRRLR